MMTLVNLAIAGHMAAIGLVAGVWALVNATANTKYVCTGESDTYVTSAQWLDAGHFATAFATSCLVLYCQNEAKATAQQARLAEVFCGLGGLIFLSTVITTASVCSNGDCITNAAVDLARFGNDRTTYNLQVKSMLGIKSGAGSDVTQYPCGNLMSPTFFSTPRNYCASATVNAGSCETTTVSSAERCLVYACSNLVPGDVTRYTISMVCLIVQVAGAAVLAVHLRRAVAPATVHASDEVHTVDHGNAEMLSREVEMTTTRKRTGAAVSGKYYSSARKDIAF